MEVKKKKRKNMGEGEIFPSDLIEDYFKNFCRLNS